MILIHRINNFVGNLAGLLKWAAPLILVIYACPVQGQILGGEWVEQSQRDIEAHRMTDLRVIVLDLEGRTVPNATVHIEMQRHAFAWGVHLDPRQFADPAHFPTWNSDSPVWRCFSAAALDRAAAWPAMQPDEHTQHDGAVDNMLAWCNDNRLPVRFGGVTSADPQHLPAWVVDSDDAELRSALEARITQVIGAYGPRIRQFDLHTHMVDHHLVRARLGVQMIRQMHELVHVLAPQAQIGARFENCLIGQRLQTMLQTIAELREAFVPMDVLVLDESVGGTILQAPLSRGMVWMRDVEMPVVIARLEVSGNSPTAAAVNFETVLRVLFAEPAIEGVFLSGVTGDQVEHETAALIDEDGRLTAAGQVFDGLVRQLWWTDRTLTSDELGNVQARVFAGTYRLTATLPDGATAQMQVYLPVAGRAQLIVLQPIAVAAMLPEHQTQRDP